MNIQNEHALVNKIMASQKHTQKLIKQLVNQREHYGIIKDLPTDSIFYNNHYVYGLFVDVPFNNATTTKDIYDKRNHLQLEFYTYNNNRNANGGYFMFSAVDSETLYPLFSKYSHTFFLSEHDIKVIQSTQPNVKLLKLNLKDYIKWLQDKLGNSFDYYYHKAKTDIDNGNDIL